MSDSVRRNGILAGGNFIVDTVKIIDSWPEQDTLCSILSHSSSNGGGPYNILKNFARLAPGLPLEACGLLGDDPQGRWVLNDCAEAGINTTQLMLRAGAATSATDAMTVGGTGRRTFFHERGANAKLDVADFDFSKTTAKIFSLGYLMLLDSLDVLGDDGSTGAAVVLKAARSAGLITAVDAVSAANPRFRKIAVASLKEADIFFVNELEAGWIIGYEVTQENLEIAIRELADLGSRGVVVLHMPQMAIAYSLPDDRIETQPSVNLPNSEIVGATGAGDAFATGFLYAVHEGWSLKQSLNCAVCVAAMSLTDSTPSGGMKGLDDCMLLAETHGYKKQAGYGAERLEA